jgi:hypothetical protein
MQRINSSRFWVGGQAAFAVLRTRIGGSGSSSTSG